MNASAPSIPTNSKACRLAHNLRELSVKSAQATGIAGHIPYAHRDHKLENKIRRGKKLSQREQSAVHSLVRQFSRLSEFVRLLVTSSRAESYLASIVLGAETYANAMHIRDNPTEGVKMVAANVPDFPLLVTMRPQSTETLRDQLGTLTVGSNLPPGFHRYARWKSDLFANEAALILDLWRWDNAEVKAEGEIEPKDLSKVTIDDWSEIAGFAEREYFAKIFSEGSKPSIVIDLEKELPVGDKTYRSRARQRIKDNIMDRLRGMLRLND